MYGKDDHPRAPVKLAKGLDLGRVPVNVLLAVLLLAIFIVSLFMGRYSLDPIVVILIVVSRVLESAGGLVAACTGVRLSVFWSIPHTWTPVMEAVIWDVRLPRSLAVLLVGAGLAVSGAVFQGTFRNPLVSETILGVSSGAGFGAALGIMVGLSLYGIQLVAFVFALLAVGMTYFIGRVYRSNPTLVLVLGGIIVGSMFSAFTSLLKYVADPYERLPSIVFWLMGSFSKVSMVDVYLVAPAILICMAILLLVRWRLNVLSMGEEEARALGVDTKTLRAVIILCATVITAGAVCISGLIGWVGLVIPQACRLIVGPDHRRLIPASILVGASFLLVVDLVCRNLTTGEIPVSIVTSIVGAPIFLYLLKKVKEGWT